MYNLILAVILGIIITVGLSIKQNNVKNYIETQQSDTIGQPIDITGGY